jgi:hypothetical protein
MEMIVDEPDKQTSYNKLYNKILDISDDIGNLIYEEKDINSIKNKVYGYIKPKPIKAKIDDRKLVDMIELSIKHEKESRRLIGLSILGIIILGIILVTLYIVNYLLSLLFNIMEWWLIAIVMLGIIIPLFTAIAYLVAKGDY